MKIIKKAQEYDVTLAKAYLLMQEDFELCSEKADKLDLITMLIEHYVEAYYPIMPPSSIEVVKFL